MTPDELIVRVEITCSEADLTQESERARVYEELRPALLACPPSIARDKIMRIFAHRVGLVCPPLLGRSTS